MLRSADTALLCLCSGPPGTLRKNHRTTAAPRSSRGAPRCWRRGRYGGARGRLAAGETLESWPRRRGPQRAATGAGTGLPAGDKTKSRLRRPLFPGSALVSRSRSHAKKLSSTFDWSGSKARQYSMRLGTLWAELRRLTASRRWRSTALRR